jgi:hypothetical protein
MAFGEYGREMRQALRGKVAVRDFDAGMFGAQAGDDRGGQAARSGIFTKDAGIDVQEFHEPLHGNRDVR